MLARQEINHFLRFQPVEMFLSGQLLAGECYLKIYLELGCLF